MSLSRINDYYHWYYSDKPKTNYKTSPGYTYQDFTDYSNWTVGSGVKSQVTGGIQVTPNAINTTATLDKNIANADFSGVTSITLEFDVSDRLNVAEVNLLLSTSATSGSINGTRILFQYLQADIVNGFNRATIHKDYGVANNGVTWADVFKWVRVQVKSSAAGVPNVVIRNLTFNQVNKPIAIIEFDDFGSAIYSSFYPLVAGKTNTTGKPVKGSLAAQTNVIGNGGSMTGANIQTMYAAGWDVVTHAHVHTDYTTFTEAQIQSDMNSQRTILGALGIVDHITTCHAYTNGARNATVISTLQALGVKYARTSDNGLQSHENKNYMEIRSISKSSGTTAASLYATIDKCAKNGSLYFTYSHADYNATQLGLEIDYILSKGIQIMTQGEYIANLKF